VPMIIRWPNKIPAGRVENGITSGLDWFPTLVSLAGNANITSELLKGKMMGGTNYKVHLDGYDFGPALRGEGAWPRHDFLYWTDDGQVAALRYDDWKVTFLEQKAHGMRVWQEPFTVLRAPLLTNLRMDPFELAEQENAMGYQRWYIDRMFVMAPAASYVGAWLQSFRDFPPRQKPGTFNLERVMESVTQPSGN